MAIRGECPFTEKSRHAENAGASVVMIFNTEPGLPIVPGGSEKRSVASMVVTERTRREMRRLGVTQTRQRHHYAYGSNRLTSVCSGKI